MRSSLFLDVTQRWLGVTVSGQSCSPWRIHCGSLLLPYICLFLLVNDKQLTCSWHHVKAIRHWSQYAAGSVWGWERRNRTSVLFSPPLFGDWLWTVELEQGIWSESCRKWDGTKDGGLHRHTREWMQVSSWLNSFAVRLNSSRGTELSCWKAWNRVCKIG